jgi:hypothetical protein
MGTTNNRKVINNHKQKKTASYSPSFFVYDVGGTSTGAVSGFWRRVKKPTATGTNKNTVDKHNNPKPIAGGKVCGAVTPPFVTSTGIPRTMITPHTQLMMLKHPQKIAVKMVAIIPMVLFCILHSPLI